MSYLSSSQVTYSSGQYAPQSCHLVTNCKTPMSPHTRLQVKGTLAQLKKARYWISAKSWICHYLHICNYRNSKLQRATSLIRLVILQNNPTHHVRFVCINAVYHIFYCDYNVLQRFRTFMLFCWNECNIFQVNSDICSLQFKMVCCEVYHKLQTTELYES